MRAALAATVVGLGAGVALAQDAAPNWNSQCVSRDRASPATCTLSHSVALQETGQILFRIEVRTRPDRDAVEVIVTAPLGLYLPAGLNLSVDDEALLALDIQRCEQGTCVAGDLLPEAALAAMREGERLQIAFAPAPSAQQSIEIPLSGFDALFDAVE